MKRSWTLQAVLVAVIVAVASCFRIRPLGRVSTGLEATITSPTSVPVAQVISIADPRSTYSKDLWNVLRNEAKSIASEDIRTSTLIANAVLVPRSLEDALVECLAFQLEGPLFKATQLKNIFMDVLAMNSSISSAWAIDLLATTINDPSSPSIASVMLLNKGFHALAAYRLANTLWYNGRDAIARCFQSLISRTFDSDIHPACLIGPGCCFSSGSGIVLGETGSVGRDCTFSHGVTLGGTGKESGDRHPKVGNGVYCATGATVLGNIHIGDGAVINAGSVVTKPVEAFTRVGGVPAKLISSLPNVVCHHSTGHRQHFVDESKIRVSDDMTFHEFCAKYLSDLPALRRDSVSLPNQA